MNHRYEIQTMERDQVHFAIDLAAKEGWNPGLHDAGCFYNADPRGFLIGLLDGRPIGCISAVSYYAASGGLPFGFVGFYVVVPEYRKRGYGIRLWNRAISSLANHKIGLDGVLEQQANYQKSGFQYAYRNSRFMRVAQPSSTDAVEEAAGVVAIETVSFEKLCLYDQRFFPAQRREFLRCWITMPDAKAVAYVEGSEITGYGVIRKCLVGYKIGPLFADSTEIAETLFTTLSSYAELESPVYLDVPEANPAALALAARRGMTKVFETARMYTGDAPAIAVNGIYGVTTLELG